MKVLSLPVSRQVMVPPGSYYLGDPCYSVPDGDWDELLSSCDYFRASPVGKVRGFEVLSFSTAYGDGVYKDQHGNAYSVDSGMIGLVPVELCDGESLYDEPERMVTFASETLCETNGDGRLYFGSYFIDTKRGEA